MSSILSPNKMPKGPTLQLTRTGVGAVTAIASAALVAALLGWSVYALNNENQELRAQIGAMKGAVAQAKAVQPLEKKVETLTKVVQYQLAQSQQVSDINSQVQRLATAMPEFKSPQYREPFQALLEEIRKLDLAVKTLQTEVTE
jgi:D-arabinose 1-dehydrogenase-like Zn-dependent alcohol dehydrogenase